MQVFIIDTFTSEKFSGNPTAVCLPDPSAGDDILLSFARELNLPVTAFVQKENAGTRAIRYFTVTKEIPACGHATLAAARAVAELAPATTEVTFRTVENILIRAVVHAGIITMTYPKYEPTPCPVPTALLQSLQIEQYSFSGFCKELETLFIGLDHPAVLRNIRPDYRQLLAGSEVIKEVVVTSVSDNEKYDFLLRSFCPWVGIDEDPVTGSVHTVLAGYWKAKLGKSRLKAYQASARGGEIYVTASDDTVQIGGNTVIVLKGDSPV